MITKIISGGQTGVDLGALLAALELKIPTGGTAPKGYRTEVGQNFALKHVFKLEEHSSSNYNPRTMENVKNSDGTVIFGYNIMSTGSKLTVNICKRLNKPFKINPSRNQLISWIKKHNISILNIAGNRESSFPGLQDKVRDFLIRVFTSEEYLKK